MSPYVIPPTIPASMTMAQYRRLSPQQRRQASMRATTTTRKDR